MSLAGLLEKHGEDFEISRAGTTWSAKGMREKDDEGSFIAFPNDADVRDGDALTGAVSGFKCIVERIDRDILNGKVSKIRAYFDPERLAATAKAVARRKATFNFAKGPAQTIWPNAIVNVERIGIASYDTQSQPVVTKISLGELCSSGAYGGVYRGKQLDIGRDVAVKLIDPAYQDKAIALAHARALAKVHHPNVVTVHCVEKVKHPESSEVVDAIIMEWVEGDTLGDRLSGPRFEAAEAITVCRDVIAGLGAIHEANIAHSDFHAGNVILTGASVKIIDISHNEATTASRLSAIPLPGRVSCDIDCLRWIVNRALSHSDIRVDVIGRAVDALTAAKSLDEISRALDEMELENQRPIPFGGIPTVEKLPKVELVSGVLSGIAARILYEASRDESAEIRVEGFRPTEVQFITNGKTLNQLGNARSRIVYSEALEVLKAMGLIRSRDCYAGYDLYEVTGKGFEASERVYSVFKNEGIVS